MFLLSRNFKKAFLLGLILLTSVFAFAARDWVICSVGCVNDSEAYKRRVISICGYGIGSSICREDGYQRADDLERDCISGC